MTGYLPWLSIEAGADEIVMVAHLPIPKTEEVERCMNCPYEDCLNCMGGKSQRRKYATAGRPPVCDIEKIRRLVNAGKTNREICEEVGCSKPTLARYKRKLVMSA